MAAGWSAPRHEWARLAAWLAAALAALVSPLAATPVFAQTDSASDAFPSDAHVLFESLAVVPSIRITNLGWDDNVFYASREDLRKVDFTAAVSPSVQALFRQSAVRVRGQSDVYFVYYKDVTQLQIHRLGQQRARRAPARSLYALCRRPLGEDSRPAELRDRAAPGDGSTRDGTQVSTCDCPEKHRSD